MLYHLVLLQDGHVWRLKNWLGEDIWLCSNWYKSLLCFSEPPKIFNLFHWIPAMWSFPSICYALPSHATATCLPYSLSPWQTLLSTWPLHLSVSELYRSWESRRASGSCFFFLLLLWCPNVTNLAEQELQRIWILPKWNNGLLSFFLRFTSKGQKPKSYFRCAQWFGHYLLWTYFSWNFFLLWIAEHKYTGIATSCFWNSCA